MTTMYYNTADTNQSLADSQSNKDKKSNLTKKSPYKSVAIAATIILLAFFGIIFIIGTYHVLHKTPQETLALQHDLDKDGPYPLRAIVFDSRRGIMEDVAPNAHFDRPLPVEKSKQGKIDVQYILLLHGIKSSGELWLSLVEQWTQKTGFDVVFILPDLLGHGKSPWPLATCYDPMSHVASLRTLLERLVPAGAPLHIGGHSLGAMLSLELAGNLLEHSPPSSSTWNLQTLTLMSTPYYRNDQEAHDAAYRHSFFFRHQTLTRMFCGYLMCRQHWLWRPLLQKSFQKLYPRMPKSLFHSALQHSCQGVESCIRHSVLQHRAHGAAAQVRSCGLSTLLIDAENDSLCTESRATLADDLAPFCTSILIPNAGHTFVASKIEQILCNFKSFVEASVLLQQANSEKKEERADTIDTEFNK